MTQRAIAMLFLGTSLLYSQVALAQAGRRSLACSGSMNNGWNFRAESNNGRFTQINWTRSGEAPQVSTLTFYSNNAQGQLAIGNWYQASFAT